MRVSKIAIAGAIKSTGTITGARKIANARPHTCYTGTRRAGATYACIGACSGMIPHAAATTAANTH